MASNPEKTKVDDTEGEREDSDEQWSDDESETREIVLRLPALSISGSVVEREEDEARLNEQAVVAAELVMAAADEAGMKGKSVDGESGGSGGKKKIRPRTLTKTDDELDGSDKGEAKKPKRKDLAHPPEGPPVCHVCGRDFGSWKAVFGHMRAHRERNFYGCLPPPALALMKEMCSILGRESASVLAAGGGSSGGLVDGGGSSAGCSASGGGGASGGEGGSGLRIDLNVEPEEDVEEATESESIAKFDLNKSPPKDG